MQLLSENDVLGILSHLTREQCLRLLDSLNDALKLYSSEASAPPEQPRLHQPLRSNITTRNKDTSLFMPCSDTENTSIKVVTLPHEKPSVGVILVNSAQGEPLGLVRAAQITAFRTALTAMSFCRTVQGLKREHLVFFGSGRQVEWHIRLALQLFDEVKQITVVNRGKQRLDQLDKNVVAPLGSVYPNVEFSLIAKEDNRGYDTAVKSALCSADAVFGCTPSTEPLFPYSYLESRGNPVLISLIGSYTPQMREIDTQTLLSGGDTIYVDSKDACLEESGELNDAGVTKSQLVELGGLLNDNKQVQMASSNIVFKCVGMGVMDLVMGRMLLKFGHENNVGVDVDEF